MVRILLYSELRNRKDDIHTQVLLDTQYLLIIFDIVAEQLKSRYIIIAVSFPDVRKICG